MNNNETTATLHDKKISNIRTNLRTSRSDTTYIISVCQQGIKTPEPYIYASFIASTTTAYFTEVVRKRAQELGEINETLKVYAIAYDSARGITSPTKATAEAIRRYQVEILAEDWPSPQGVKKCAEAREV